MTAELPGIPIVGSAAGIICCNGGNLNGDINGQIVGIRRIGRIHPIGRLGRIGLMRLMTLATIGSPCEMRNRSNIEATSKRFSVCALARPLF